MSGACLQVLTHSYVGTSPSGIPRPSSPTVRNCAGCQGEDFFSKWSFFVGGDPTHGTVHASGIKTALQVKTWSPLLQVKFLSFQNASMQG